MKSKSVFTVYCLLSSLAFAGLVAQAQTGGHPRYSVTDLGTLGGSFSLAYGINDRGQIDGFSTLSGDAALHSFILERGVMTDLGTLGGQNSQSFAGLNDVPQVPGSAEESTPDPNGEDFCGFGTHLICLGFLWQDGLMAPLDTLGGNNSQAAEVNARGQIAGYAETARPDKHCPAPQVLHFRPVIWDEGSIRSLPLYKGDSEGAAFWINNRGDVVGASGSCSIYNPDLGLPLEARHALLWSNGKVTDLGTLGGKLNNAGFAINERGEIVGASDLPGDTYQHAFLWQKGTMSDLGTLKGDVLSAALGINNGDQVTGVSSDANGNLRAFLWQDGAMTDLNTLVSDESPLYLLHGFGIGSDGRIVGFGCVPDTCGTSSPAIHAFLATPCDRNQAECRAGTGNTSPDEETSERPRLRLSDVARKLLQQAMPFGRFGARPVSK